MFERITFDLEGTLIDQETGELRPGAEELLALLRNHGHDLVLWTSGRQPLVDNFFEKYPQLRERFSLVMSHNLFEGIDEGRVDLAALFGKERVDHVLDSLHASYRNLGYSESWRAEERLVDILKGFEGGKIPPLVGSSILVDNIRLTTASRDLGFQWVDANKREDDSAPDDWARRVASTILGEAA